MHRAKRIAPNKQRSSRRLETRMKNGELVDRGLGVKKQATDGIKGDRGSIEQRKGAPLCSWMEDEHVLLA